jgi:hypothetical protein
MLESTPENILAWPLLVLRLDTIQDAAAAATKLTLASGGIFYPIRNSQHDLDPILSLSLTTSVRLTDTRRQML